MRTDYPVVRIDSPCRDGVTGLPMNRDKLSDGANRLSTCQLFVGLCMCVHEVLVSVITKIQVLKVQGW